MSRQLLDLQCLIGDKWELDTSETNTCYIMREFPYLFLYLIHKETGLKLKHSFWNIGNFIQDRIQLKYNDQIVFRGVIPSIEFLDTLIETVRLDRNKEELGTIQEYYKLKQQR